MEQILNEIPVSYPDTEINSVLSRNSGNGRPSAFSVRFNHNEEPFLELGEYLSIPSFPIHHDIRESRPSAAYLASMSALALDLSAALPDVFRELVYFFDPTEPLRPRFFKLYKVEGSIYLYLLRLDIVFRHFEGQITGPGSNDFTPMYRTRRLYLDSELIPLDDVVWEESRPRSFRIRQLVSNTWIGETGRGYLQHGIWMDSDLSRFFTKLVVPDGIRAYPYFPLFCTYKTICAQALPPDPGRRKSLLPLLHRMIAFLRPEMGRIQASLKSRQFSDSLPLFIELRERIPSSWSVVFGGLRVRSYLNDREQKEYALE